MVGLVQPLNAKETPEYASEARHGEARKKDRRPPAFFFRAYFPRGAYSLLL